jgi:hypothetical protein
MHRLHRLHITCVPWINSDGSWILTTVSVDGRGCAVVDQDFISILTTVSVDGQGCAVVDDQDFIRTACRQTKIRPSSCTFAPAM